MTNLNIFQEYFATSPWPALHTQISCEDKMLSYLQGMGCSEMGKKTIFNEHPVLNGKRSLVKIFPALLTFGEGRKKNTT